MKLLSSPKALLCLFLFLVVHYFVFASLYYWIYREGFRSETKYKKRTLVGFTPVLPTFVTSGSYNIRRQAQAREALRFGNHPNGANPISWMSFDPIWKSGAMSFSDENSDLQLRGLSSQELVDVNFLAYQDVKFEFWKNESGYTGLRRMEGVWDRIVAQIEMEKLLPQADALQLKHEYITAFSLSSSGNLFALHLRIVGPLSVVMQKSTNPERLRQVVYDLIVGGLAQAILIDFSEVKDPLNFWDFLYFAATDNGDVVPVSGLARLCNALQNLIREVLLAMLTAMIVAQLLETPKFWK